ncbi:MAG TPA: hypothetical protein VKT80_04965, partial [Chloroflexota bacterium]|nr:hypothetical protein [Chloroflexota bacterium]
MILPREFPNTQPSVGTERPKVRSEGVQVIRNACLTLNSTSPEMVRSIVVLVGLDDLPVGPSSAVDLAQRIADEYELAADAHISRYRLVVRVHRL